MATKRGYLTQEELEQFADITVTDETEADDQISMAEEMLDDYVGSQNKFLKYPVQGKVSEVTSTTIFTLDTDQINSYNHVGYFVGCHVEIIGGTGIGQLRKISASDENGVITVSEAFTTSLDDTSIYKIYQIGKFPRRADVFVYTKETPAQYHKSIPEAVKRATAAQVEYRINMGDAHFATDGGETSERIGDYAVTKKAGSGGESTLIAPKARLLLKGIRNRTGEIVLE